MTTWTRFIVPSWIFKDAAASSTRGTIFFWIASKTPESPLWYKVQSIRAIEATEWKEEAERRSHNICREVKEKIENNNDSQQETETMEPEFENIHLSAPAVKYCNRPKT